MSAPRHASELQENAVWLSLSGLWAVGGAVAWLNSFDNRGDWNGSGGGSTMLALCVAATTLALRLPIFAPATGTRLRCDHAVWLLTTLCTVHWLGFFTQQTSLASDMFPVLLIFGIAEIWFIIRVRESAALPWLRASCLSVYQRLMALGTEPHLDSFRADGLAIHRRPLADLQPLADERQLLEGETCERQTVMGSDEQGRRYMSGQIKVAMAAEQMTEALSIAFSPPFAGDPDIDFECEGTTEEVHIQLIHCTPAGMRLSLKRASSPARITFALQWYATEVELSEVPGIPIPSDALP